MTALAGHSRADPVRFATFIASMNRGAAGELAAALRNGDDPQIAEVAEIIRAVDPVVIAINEFDYGAGLDRAIVGNNLDDAYLFSFIVPSNAGLATGLDLDGDGIVGSEPGTIKLARDSHGFGMFEGHYGMLVLSRHEIAVEDRKNNASIAMVAGVSVWSLSGSMSVREQTNRGRGDAISSRQT